MQEQKYKIGQILQLGTRQYYVKIVDTKPSSDGYVITNIYIDSWNRRRGGPRVFITEKKLDMKYKLAPMIDVLFGG